MSVIAVYIFGLIFCCPFFPVGLVGIVASIFSEILTVWRATVAYNQITIPPSGPAIDDDKTNAGSSQDGHKINLINKIWC